LLVSPVDATTETASRPLGHSAQVLRYRNQLDSASRDKGGVGRRRSIGFYGLEDLGIVPRGEAEAFSLHRMRGTAPPPRSQHLGPPWGRRMFAAPGSIIMSDEPP
jgi:hypothetical protein